MGRVVHFEIHADDPERAARFYSEIFGWQIQKWAGPTDYWLATTGPDDQPGINGAILRRNGPDGQAVSAFVCTIGVGDLDEALAGVVRLGGSIAQPRDAVPGIGWLAYARDTEGNIFGILQPDMAAAPSASAGSGGN